MPRKNPFRITPRLMPKWSQRPRLAARAMRLTSVNLQSGQLGELPTNPACASSETRSRLVRACVRCRRLHARTRNPPRHFRSRP